MPCEIQLLWHTGPVVHKTAEAALYTSLAYANDTSTLPPGNSCHMCHLQSPQVIHAASDSSQCSAANFTVIPLNGGGQVLVAWVANGSVAVLAWRAADNATEDAAAASVEMTAASFLVGALSNAQVNNATMEPFQQALRGSNSSAGIQGVSYRLYLIKITCTLPLPAAA